MKHKPPKSVYLLIATAVTIVLWVIFEVSRVFFIKPDQTIPGELLKPISPLIDSQTLDNIDSRLFFGPGDVPEFIIVPKVLETEEIKVVEEVIDIPKSTESAEATSSANEEN